MVKEDISKVQTGGGVEIMKASAGSGKTFSLAREYIRLLLYNRYEDRAYRHVLAVTFTNKATEEMKSRIIDELDTLVNHTEHSDYLEYLLETCQLPGCPALTVEGVKKECSKALNQILGDYGAFSVSTIDKFFQKVLRAFSREVGQFSEYQIELDRDSLVEEAVDRVLDSLSEEKGELLKWLSDSSVASIEYGDGYRLQSRLAEFAAGYMSESYRTKSKNLNIDEDKAFSEANIINLKTICGDIVQKFDEGFSIAVAGLMETAKGFKGFSSNFQKSLDKIRDYRPGRKADFGATWVSAVSDISKAFKKLAKGEVPPGEAELENLRKAVAGVQAYLTVLPQRNTAALLRSQVAVFHVADALKTEFEALLKEKNVLSLDDTNKILHDLIGETDAPFIYEKVGVRYSHFLLDEFQDTSLTQWDNFRPLLLNSISEGMYNLVVGDVKQSIYRWRNAEWKILEEKVEGELKKAVFNPLNDNYRSAPNIVRFNNAFYPMVAARMDADLAAVGSAPRSISDIYKGCEQKEHDKYKVEGQVKMVFCDKEDILSQTVDAVLHAHELGFSWKDIAVIVRKNKEGAAVASRLIDAGVPVVSNDSLQIRSGKSVMTLVSRLSAIDDPTDIIGSYNAGDFDPASIEKPQSLIDLAEIVLRGMDRDEVNADTLYVLAFMDLVRDFVSRNGNSLHAFLKYWKEDAYGKSISSPSGSDAVTIITVHKSKGLDFPYVVIPFPKKESYVDSKSLFWECPDLSDTPMEDLPPALYHTGLSEDSLQSGFRENYILENWLSHIDNINTWYVATTRASQAMCLISTYPKAEIMDMGVGETWKEISEFRYALYMFAAKTPGSGFEEVSEGCFVFGDESMKAYKDSSWEKPKLDVSTIQLEYMAPESDGNGRKQIRIKTDASDFFRERGTALHKILETVYSPSDLEGSVRKAVESGMINEEGAAEALAILKPAIDSVKDRGWFCGDRTRILDEREILLASSGRRADRVVLKEDGSVDIVDYKFGAENDKYLKQVAFYVSLYRRMGYKTVRGYIWYLEQQKIVEV